MKNPSNSYFRRGSGLFACRCCGYKTRNTGGDNADVKLCRECYDLAGEENHLSDTDHFSTNPAEILSMIAAIEARGSDASDWLEIKAAAEKLAAAA